MEGRVTGEEGDRRFKQVLPPLFSILAHPLSQQVFHSSSDAICVTLDKSLCFSCPQFFIRKTKEFGLGDLQGSSSYLMP